MQDGSIELIELRRHRESRMAVGRPPGEQRGPALPVGDWDREADTPEAGSPVLSRRGSRQHQIAPPATGVALAAGRSNWLRELPCLD